MTTAPPTDQRYVGSILRVHTSLIGSLHPTDFVRSIIDRMRLLGARDRMMEKLKKKMYRLVHSLDVGGSRCRDASHCHHLHLCDCSCLPQSCVDTFVEMSWPPRSLPRRSCLAAVHGSQSCARNDTHLSRRVHCHATQKKKKERKTMEEGAYMRRR